MLRRTISLATRTEPVWLPLPSNVRRKRSLPRRSATAKVVAIPSSSSSYSSSSTEDNQKRRSDHRRSSKNEFTVWNDPEDHALFAFRWKRLLDAHEQKAGKRKDEADDHSSRRLLSPHEVESILCEDPKLSGATARWVPMLLAEKPAQLSLSSPTSSSSSSASEEVSAVSMMDELRKRLDEQDQMRRARSQSLTAPQSPQERDFVDMVLENLELPKGSVWFTCFVHAQLLSSVKGPQRHHQPPPPPHTPAIRKRRSADASLHHTTATTTAPTCYGALHADAVDDGEGDVTHASSSANDASPSHFSRASSHRKPSPSIVVLATVALPDPKVIGVERTTTSSSSSDSSFGSSAQQEKGSSPTTKKSKKTKANKKKREETSTTAKTVSPAQEEQNDDAFRIEIGLFDSTMTISDAAKSPLFGDERR